MVRMKLLDNGRTLITMNELDYQNKWPEICRILANHPGKRIDKRGKIVKFLIFSDICNRADIKL